MWLIQVFNVISTDDIEVIEVTADDLSVLYLPHAVEFKLHPPPPPLRGVPEATIPGFY